MMEIERKYLLKYFPPEIKNSAHKEVLDIYFPKNHPHPPLRLRKNGDVYEITKKTVLSGDKTVRKEETISLSKDEFDVLSKIEGKISHKIRYYYAYNGVVFEIDVFLGDLQGLVLVDAEFKSEQELSKLIMPEFCLADVTKEVFSAGGMLCGRSYDNIQKDLERYDYKPLFLDDKQT